MTGHAITIDPAWPESFRDPGFWGEGARFESDCIIRQIPIKPVAKIGLTKRQRQALEYITTASKKLGYCPSYQEIMEACGWKSKSNVARVVDALVARGHLKKLPGAKRCLSAA